jgi:hypothetical protein
LGNKSPKQPNEGELSLLANWYATLEQEESIPTIEIVGNPFFNSRIKITLPILEENLEIFPSLREEGGEV